MCTYRYHGQRGANREVGRLVRTKSYTFDTREEVGYDPIGSQRLGA